MSLTQGSGTAITSTIVVGTKPVAGVRVEVRQSGVLVATGTSAADGSLRIEVPGAGRYQVHLIASTLPKGVTLAAGSRTTLEPIVREGFSSPVVFRIVDASTATDEGPSSSTRVLGLLASGLRFGLVIALASVGLSLIFGTTGLTNFAHGEMLTFGAIATWYFNDLGLNLVLAAVGGVLVSGVFGAVLELGLFRPLRRRRMPDLSVMVVSIGLALFLRYLFAIIFGGSPRQYNEYAAQSPTVKLGPISLPPKDLVIMAVSAAMLLGIGLFLQRSRLGTAIRAVSDDRDLSESSGIDVQRVILTVWVLSAALAGMGGVLLGTTDTVVWNMGQRVLLVMFAAVVLGGLGTAFGAMAGGLVVGIVSDLSTYWLDADLKIVVALGALVIVLLVRPSGIFGVRARSA